MDTLIRLLQWILKAAIFFALFAFALNNQHETVVRLAFGHEWRAPVILIVLAAFAVGMALGVMGMLPGWWRRRRKRAVTGKPIAQTAASDSSDAEVTGEAAHGA